MSIAADNDVVVDGNAEWARRIHDLLGHINIGTRWCWVAGRMIVHQDKRC